MHIKHSRPIYCNHVRITLFEGDKKIPGIVFFLGLMLD